MLFLLRYAKLLEFRSLHITFGISILTLFFSQTGLACLRSVPFKKQIALDTIENFKRFSNFQSTIGILKNPPATGYANAPVDIFGLLDATTAKINADGYTTQYDFELDLANITVQAHDGHYNMRGNTFAGAIRWQRGTGAYGSLISVSSDGLALPDVYISSKSPT